MRSTRTSVVAAAAVMTTASLLAACSSSSSGGSTPSGSASTAPAGSSSPVTSTPSGSTSAPAPSTSAKPVSISVVSLIPGSTKAAFAQFNQQVKEFETANPNITVKPVQYQWLATTFGAKLAAGTLPTVFTVPFTDGKALAEKGQLADLSTQAKALPYFSEFNPNVIAEATSADGKIFAIPTAAYANALHYNRKLFTEAGLDPNKPPTTWAEVEADAKQITQKTGKAGYVEMTNQNTGGWILTTLTYALGGRVETGTGTSAVANLDNPQTVQALNWLKTLRWTDNAAGSNFLLGWSDINQAFAAGNIGMYVSGSDVYTNLVQAYKIDPSIYGLTTLPLANSPDASVLGGGTLAVVRPSANEAQKDAAMKWIDFYYERPLTDQASAIRNAKTLVANGQPVGVPALPILNKTQYDLANTWIKSYINTPQSQFAPFLNNIFNQQLAPEPEASTQTLYAALDPVVQAVLTNKNADIDALLKKANATLQPLIKAGK
jgi:ABC-type glycerol-3-phosphate transport system substrate-binding protein